MVELELGQVAALGPDFVALYRAQEGTPDRTLQFLYDAARRVVGRARKVANLARLNPAARSPPIKTAAAIELSLIHI